MQQSQYQLFHQERDRIAAKNRHVMELIHDPINPLTADDLHKLADRFPERWAAYRTLLDAKP